MKLTPCNAADGQALPSLCDPSHPAHPVPSTAPPGNVAAPTGTRAGWLAVGSISVGTFVMVTTEFLPIGLLGDIASSLGVSTGAAGLMVTLPGVMAAFAGPALILAAGRLDRRWVMVALTALLAASDLIATRAPNFATLLVARLLLGLCVGGFWTFAPGAASQLVPPASQARAVSTVILGVSAATVLGVPAGTLLGSLVGWRSAFALAGAIAVLVALLQLWLLPKLPPARAMRPRDLLLPLQHPRARLVLGVTVLLVAGHFSAYTYLQPLLSQSFALSSGGLTALLLLYGAVGFLGTYVGGSLVARSSRTAVLVAGLLLAVALMASNFVGSGLLPAGGIVLLWGIAFGLIPMALTGWMIEALPQATEAGQALLVTAFQVAIASGALFGGRMFDARGIHSVMWLGGGLALLAALVVLGLGRARAPVPVSVSVPLSGP